MELPTRLVTLLESTIRPVAREVVHNQDGGAYVVIARLNRDLDLNGKFNGQALSAGIYAYCGSARGPGGLAARLGRHFRQDKQCHWHIDALTTAADHIAAIAVSGGSECQLVETMLETGSFVVPIRGFGSTDCSECRSHLLRWRPSAGK